MSWRFCSRTAVPCGRQPGRDFSEEFMQQQWKPLTLSLQSQITRVITSPGPGLGRTVGTPILRPPGITPSRQSKRASGRSYTRTTRWRRSLTSLVSSRLGDGSSRCEDQPATTPSIRSSKCLNSFGQIRTVLTPPRRNRRLQGKRHAPSSSSQWRSCSGLEAVKSLRDRQ